MYWRSKRYKRSKWVGPQEMEIFSGSKFLNLTHWSHCSEWWWDCSGLCWARISRFALGGSAWTPCACFRVCSDLFQGTGTGTRTGKRVHFRGRLISFNASNLRINEGATLHMEMLAARRRSWEAIRAVRCGAVVWFNLVRWCEERSLLKSPVALALMDCPINFWFAKLDCHFPVQPITKLICMNIYGRWVTPNACGSVKST